MTTTLRRLTDSCLTVTDGTGTTLFDPGFFTFGPSGFDLDGLGEVQRVLVTHEHGDHVAPDFVRWLVDRGDDVVVHGNAAVAALLAPHDVEVDTGAPAGASFEDVDHETLPNGTTVPNRAWTVGGFTHPGDSYGLASAAEVMGMAFVAPWGSLTDSVRFVARLAPRAVVPVHDFYLSASGRETLAGFAAGALEAHGVEVIALDWGDTATI